MGLELQMYRAKIGSFLARRTNVMSSQGQMEKVPAGSLGLY
jgi:hypothetical protein